jgi:hypothetical protein
LPHYHISQHDGRTEFRPAGFLVMGLVLSFLTGAVFAAAIGVFLLVGDPQSWPPWVVGGAFLLAAVVLGLLAYWGWRTRRAALVIGREGTVFYAGACLCVAGQVKAVAVVPSPGGEVGDCEVVLEVKGGRRVGIPSQYFSGFASQQQAMPFAEQLAGALVVGVKT